MIRAAVIASRMRPSRSKSARTGTTVERAVEEARLVSLGGRGRFSLRDIDAVELLELTSIPA